MNPETISQTVKERYGKAAQSWSGAASCCPSAAPPATGFGAQHGLYTAADLASVPQLAVKLSRGCGNPTSFADLRPGETVVDFGCGAGIDVILAARRVAPDGKVIGVDFTPEMIERALQVVAEAGATGSVEFVLCDLKQISMPNDVADAVISNCVINLCPNKEAVFREAFRILRPGGRIAVSDVEYSEKPDPEVKSRFEATWAGCVGGAMEEQAYFDLIKEAGFEEIHVVARHPLDRAELEEMSCCPGPEFTPHPAKDDLASVQGKVTSIKFTAVKPVSRH